MNTFASTSSIDLELESQVDSNFEYSNMTPDMEQIDDDVQDDVQIDAAPASSHAGALSESSDMFSPKSWSEDPLPASDLSSHSSSRTSSSEYSPAASEKSSFRYDEPISYAVAEYVSTDSHVSKSIEYH